MILKAFEAFGGIKPSTLFIGIPSVVHMHVSTTYMYLHVQTIFN